MGANPPHTVNNISVIEKELAIQIINNMGCNSEIAVNLFGHMALVDMLMKCATRGETPSVKEWAIRSITNMAFAEENQHRMFQSPHLVSTLIQCARNGESFGIREWSVAALDNLSIPEDTRIHVFQMPFLVEALLECAGMPKEKATRGLREKALKAINNFTGTPEIAVDLFARSGFVDLILDCESLQPTGEEDDDLSSSSTLVIREARIGIFLGLSCAEENHLGMFAHGRLLNALIERIYAGSILEQEFAIGTIMNLAVSSPNRVGLFHVEGLLELMMHTIESGLNARIKENSVGLLDNLALENEIVVMLKRKKRLLFALLDCVLDDGSSSLLKQWSLLLFKKLGFSQIEQSARVYKLILILCSVLERPNVAPQSKFRLLPKEIVREIAQRLIPPLRE